MPPAPEAVAVPLLPPLQVTEVDKTILAVTDVAGSAIVTVVISLHTPDTSVTVTE